MLALRLAWRNLWRHPRRTWLTASAIAFSSLLLIFMITLQLGAYDLFVENSMRVYLGSLQVQRKGYLDKPQIRSTVKNAEALRDGVRQTVMDAPVTLRANAFALAVSRERSNGVMVVGVDPLTEPRLSTLPGRVQRGRYLQGGASHEVVLGVTLARNLKVNVGDELTLLGSAKDGSVAATVAPVVGLFDSGTPDIDRGLLQMPLGAFQELFGMPDEAHAIVIGHTTGQDFVALKHAIEARLPNDQTLVVLDWEALIPGLKQLIQADIVQNWFMYVSLILVVTFSILNTFFMSVLERTREFGVLLALGLRPRQIGSLVLLESSLLTLIGLALGLVGGTSIAYYFYVNGFSFPGLKEVHAQFGLPGVVTPKITVVSVLLGPLVIFVFTVLSSILPTLKIRKLKPVEAIHTV
jgi:ABC-type lipoprotein release transport system permease subunit